MRCVLSRNSNLSETRLLSQMNKRSMKEGGVCVGRGDKLHHLAKGRHVCECVQQWLFGTSLKVYRLLCSRGRFVCEKCK